MRPDRFAILLAPLALGACGSVPASYGTYSAPPPRPARYHPAQRPAPKFHAEPGLEGVIGADEGTLVRQFGQPRLNVIEEDAVKLQWSGVPCILDVYLYPPQGGGRPLAAYVDARRGDGRDVDRAACVAALRQSR
ncbi:MAG: hypothetical protein KGL48_12210 [Sphingomonadales bacterium]|nr:hypothetical protein [Sphingomonadales bacterium]MDE2568238.1 hypothetical protein [Sphingomonadales bacterium]